LVSTGGFPGDCSDQGTRFLSTHAYSSRDLAQLPLRSCVTVVTGKMVGINRKSKHVCVCDGRRVPYDHLVLCTGLQYQVPSNLFTLNEPWDCRAARRWLQDHFVELQNAIVYGNSIDVYTTVEALLSLGVQGRRIHLVLTPSEAGVPGFSDPEVEKAVAAATEKAEVRVHRNCLLAQMNDGEEEPDLLTSVAFTTDAEPLRLQCGVFINLSNKGVDYDAFRSIIDSFLVFDSRLVISAAFCTSDTAICGAGPLTKFSLCYHADEWSHASFNSKEVGQDLAAMLLSLYDPTQEPADEPSLETDLLVPLYKHAKVQGKLPGGYHYLHDRSIVTGRVETGNYFRLHLDSYELVGTLTCFSLKPFPFNNYLSLYGKHQQLLGQLSTRYQQDLIRDLYALGSSTVKYLTYNRNLLPMFAYPGQL
uniref:CFAP61 dimerisation domain-containing protein n=1 Tax=Mola mola TaxID=94237 RepID=A0A3Q3X4R9_MOLML